MLSLALIPLHCVHCTRLTISQFSTTLGGRINKKQSVPQAMPRHRRGADSALIGFGFGHKTFRANISAACFRTSFSIRRCGFSFRRFNSSCFAGVRLSLPWREPVALMRFARLLNADAVRRRHGNLLFAIAIPLLTMTLFSARLRVTSPHSARKALWTSARITGNASSTLVLITTGSPWYDDSDGLPSFEPSSYPADRANVKSRSANHFTANRPTFLSGSALSAKGPGRISAPRRAPK
jgi:hypothetical protein